MDDIIKVGPTKFVGYIPIPDIYGMGVDCKTIIDWAVSQGFAWQIYPEDYTDTKDRKSYCASRMYVYDKFSLAFFLDEHKELLGQYHIPIEPDAYIEHIQYHSYYWYDNLKIHKIIGLSFADERFVEINGNYPLQP